MRTRNAHANGGNSSPLCLRPHPGSYATRVCRRLRSNVPPNAAGPARRAWLALARREGDTSIEWRHEVPNSPERAGASARARPTAQGTARQGGPPNPPTWASRSDQRRPDGRQRPRSGGHCPLSAAHCVQRSARQFGGLLSIGTRGPSPSTASWIALGCCATPCDALIPTRHRATCCFGWPVAGVPSCDSPHASVTVLRRATLSNRRRAPVTERDVVWFGAWVGSSRVESSRKGLRSALRRASSSSSPRRVSTRVAVGPRRAWRRERMALCAVSSACEFDMRPAGRPSGVYCAPRTCLYFVQLCAVRIPG